MLFDSHYWNILYRSISLLASDQLLWKISLTLTPSSVHTCVYYNVKGLMPYHSKICNWTHALLSQKNTINQIQMADSLYCVTTTYMTYTFQRKKEKSPTSTLRLQYTQFITQYTYCFLRCEKQHPTNLFQTYPLENISFLKDWHTKLLLLFYDNCAI